MALDKNAKTFVVHVTALSALTMQPNLSCRAQIRLLLAEKASTKVVPKYSDYTDIFLFDLVIELQDNTSMNEYAIKLVEIKQLLYGPIYSLGPVELEILKTYIETHLKTGFIQFSKFLVGEAIFFDQKPDRSLCLCINY